MINLSACKVDLIESKTNTDSVISTLNNEIMLVVKMNTYAHVLYNTHS